MPLALLPFFWLLALMSSLGAQASEAVPVQQILNQLAQSNQDGQFVENLKPVTHPALVAKGLSHPFMQDGKPSPDLTVAITGPDGSAVATLRNAAHSPLPPDRLKLSVNLWPEQDEAAFRQGPGGEISISFRWISGTKGEASSFNPPLPSSACTYRHIPEPAFTLDRLCLATFGGPGGKTDLLEICRLPAAP